MNSRGGFPSKPPEVRISVKMQIEIIGGISNPSSLSVVQGRLYIKHQLLKTKVVFAGPRRNVSGKVSNSSQQVEPSQAGRIENLHEHSSRYALEPSFRESLLLFLKHADETVILLTRTTQGSPVLGGSSLAGGTLWYLFER